MNFYLDIFKSPIRTTLCGHMFCEACLLDVSKGEARWLCPECRKLHECSVDTLTRNYRFENFVEKFNKEQPVLKPKNLFGTCKTHDRAIEYRE